MSNLIRGISENGGVVFCGVDSTEIVRTAVRPAVQPWAACSPVRP